MGNSKNELCPPRDNGRFHDNFRFLGEPMIGQCNESSRLNSDMVSILHGGTLLSQYIFFVQFVRMDHNINRSSSDENLGDDSRATLSGARYVCCVFFCGAVQGRVLERNIDH